MPRPPPRSTLFPYTTLFRSRPAQGQLEVLVVEEEALVEQAALTQVLRVEQHRATAPSLDILRLVGGAVLDRKSTRLNSSHRCISYAVFCLKKKKKIKMKAHH